MRRCQLCSADSEFLRIRNRPDYRALPNPVRVADLFSGGGGLSLGVAEAARRAGRGADIVLAVERDPRAAAVYRLNFREAHLLQEDMCNLFDGTLGKPATQSERRIRQEIGVVHVLVAGPPCQGHSDLNNYTRRRDPRNVLYLRAIRAAEILKPTFIVLENVPAIERDEDGVLGAATAALIKTGYAVATRVLDLSRFGVPQRRRRHVLLGALGNLFEPAIVLDAASPCAEHRRTVAWAIKDLLRTHSSSSLLDAPAVASVENRRRMRWLLKNDKYDLPDRLRPVCHQGDHSYTSMYGRLRWDSPAQTITTGFGSMGQGRFVHPSMARTLTPHEAARLQTLPDFFDLDQKQGRGAWATIIGNAVPPLLGVHLVEPLLCALVAEAVPRDGEHRATTSDAGSIGRSRRAGVPPASSEEIRVRMSTTRRRETGPELALRSELHRLGCRFRVDRTIEGTRRRADIVFPRDRLAVFLDGCFWHSCPVHGSIPKQNRAWWIAKLEANRTRDSDTDRNLEAIGWNVLRFWEHDDPNISARRVQEALAARRWKAPL